MLAGAFLSAAGSHSSHAPFARYLNCAPCRTTGPRVVRLAGGIDRRDGETGRRIPPPSAPRQVPRGARTRRRSAPGRVPGDLEVEDEPGGKFRRPVAHLLPSAPVDRSE